jgi:hypothetical protein
MAPIPKGFPKFRDVNFNLIYCVSCWITQFVVLKFQTFKNVCLLHTFHGENIEAFFFLER